MLLTPRRTPTDARSSWLSAALLGAALGTVLLGAGGRLAMRGVTLWEGRTHLFSLTGSVTVIAWGAGLGAAAGLLRVALEAGLRRAAGAGRAAPRWLAVALWWLATGAIALVLLTPWTPSRLTLFPPVVLAFLAAFEAAWRRRSRRDAHGAARAEAAA